MAAGVPQSERCKTERERFQDRSVFHNLALEAAHCDVRHILLVTPVSRGAPEGPPQGCDYQEVGVTGDADHQLPDEE